MRKAIGLLALAVVISSGCDRPPALGRVADMKDAEVIRVAFTAGQTGEGSGTAAAGPVGTGWGTLKGKFVFAGDPPQMSPYNVNKDQEVCMPGGQAPLQETLLVDSASGGIKNIVVFLRDASRVHDSAKPSEEPVEFDQKVCVFLSHVFPVGVGQPIEIKNSDNVGHNTNIAGRKNTFNQTIPAGQSLTFVAQKEEAVPAPVSCSIHPWMQAYMFPRENMYVAVTSEDGTFEIPNLPAGEKLEMQVWHESATGAGGSLIVNTPEAKELKWSNKGRFEVEIEEDGTKEIQVAVPPSAFKI